MSHVLRFQIFSYSCHNGLEIQSYPLCSSAVCVLPDRRLILHQCRLHWHIKLHFEDLSMHANLQGVGEPYCLYHPEASSHSDCFAPMRNLAPIAYNTGACQGWEVWHTGMMLKAALSGCAVSILAIIYSQLPRQNNLSQKAQHEPIFSMDHGSFFLQGRRAQVISSLHYTLPIIRCKSLASEGRSSCGKFNQLDRMLDRHVIWKDLCFAKMYVFGGCESFMRD